MSSNQIKSLTPEQEAKIPSYLDKYRKVGLSTERANRPRAEEALRASMEYLKLPTNPEIIWVDSPTEGAKLAAQSLKGSDDVTQQEIQDQIGKASFGSFEAYWVCLYSFIANELPVKKDPLIDIVNTITEECGVYWVFEGRIIVSEKPTHIALRDDKLHNPDGLALEYSDGTGIFAIDGTRYKSMMDVAMQDSLKDDVKVSAQR